MTEDIATSSTRDTEKTKKAHQWPTLILPRSGLTLEDHVLMRKTRDGKIIARHPLDEIDDIKVITRIYPGAIIGGLLFISGGVAARVLIAAPAWGWTLCGIAVALGFLLLMGSWGPLIRLRVGEEEISYFLNDQLEDCMGFVSSLTCDWQRK